LSRRRKKYSVTLKKSIRNLNLNLLKKETKKAKKYCKEISDEYFLNQSKILIPGETEKTRLFCKNPDEIDNIHKTRKHLKKLIYIIKISVGITSDRELIRMEIALKEVEELLGKWHDGIILTGSLEKLKIDTKQAASLKKFIENLNRQNQVLLSTAKLKMALIFKSMPKPYR